MRVRTLGISEITIGENTIGVGRPRIFVCLFLLACASPNALSRAQLAAALWPSSDLRERNHRLRTLLYRARRLGAPIVCNDATVSLAERPSLDFREYSTLPSSLVDVEDGAALIGTVLPGLDAVLAMHFGDQLEHVRDTIVATMTRWVEAAIRLAKAAGEWRLVVTIADSARSVDPSSHVAWLSLAEAQCLTGDRVRALSTVDEYLLLVPDSDVERLTALDLRRRIAREQPREWSEAPLIGRDVIMRRIWSAVARAEHGHGGALLLWGGAGCGKTRLLREVDRARGVIPARVLPFAAQAVHALQPLGLIRHLVARLLDQPGAAGCDPDAYQWLREFTLPNGWLTPRDDPPPEVLFQGMVDLLAAIIEESPLVVTIDEAHLAHASGWPLWRALLHWSTGQRLIWLFAARAVVESDLRLFPESGLLPRLWLQDQPTSSPPINAAMIAF